MVNDGIEQTTFANLIAAGALEIGDGYRAKNDELGGNGLIFLRAGHVTDTHIDFEGVDRFDVGLEPRLKSKVAKPGDAVVTTKGNSTGRTAYVKPSMPPFVYSPHLSYWRSTDPDQIESGFLRYWSRGQEFTEQLAGMKASTDMAPYLSLVDQRRLRITILPVREQRAIAHILGTLDDKIELNRRMSETLEEMARALFKSWFVGFDPVRAKAQGRDPGILHTTADLFPDSFEQSELGEIPLGWTATTLADLSLLNPESWTKASRPDVLEYVDLSSTKWGRIESTTVYRQPDAPSRAQRVLRQGDSIVGTVRPGNGSFALVSDQGLTGSTGFAVLRPKNIEFREFVYLAATSTDNIAVLSRLADGGAYPAVAPEVVAATPIVRPTHNILAVFSKLTETAFSRIAASERQSRTLAALRDTLLPMLISGELRIKHAERFVGVAL